MLDIFQTLRKSHAKFQTIITTMFIHVVCIKENNDSMATVFSCTLTVRTCILECTDLVIAFKMLLIYFVLIAFLLQCVYKYQKKRSFALVNVQSTCRQHPDLLHV